MSTLTASELERARHDYRTAMRRYGENPSQEARVAWMEAGRRLAAAVTAKMDVA